MLRSNTLQRKLSILGLVCIFIFSLAGTSLACRMYGAISDDFPDGLFQTDLIDAPNSLKNLANSGNIDGWGIAYYPYYLVDPGFNDSADSPELRTDGTGQDWYESRNDNPDLLTLNTGDIGGNSTNKAALLNYGIANNSYLTQELSSTQTEMVTVTFDIFIDRIEDSGTYDRSGLIYIGDDRITTNAPTGTSDERCVYLAFYDSTPGDTGSDLEIRARTLSTQSYGTTSAWELVASGISYDSWNTVKIVLDLAAGTYDLYVNDLLESSDIPKYSGYTPVSVTHMSFVADSSGRGDFYIDNVRDTIERGAERAYTDSTYDEVVAHINTIEPKATIAHVRDCTSGCCASGSETIADPHPFYRYKNGKRWTFVHNGGVSISLLESLIGTTYLTENPPNGSDIQDCIDDTVDSELYFLYILKMIEDNGWNATTGVVAAVNELIDNGEEGMNFILSDGDRIWAFRKPQLSSHTLYYRYYDDTDGMYSAVASAYPSGTQGDWELISEDYLVVLTADAAPVVIDITTYTEELIIDNTGLESASIGPYTIVDNQIDFTLNTENIVNASSTSPDYTYWTNFRVSNVAGKEVTFNINNADAVPFLTDGTNEAQMVFSCDGGATWDRITDNSYAAPTYTFTETFAPTCDQVQIATFFPFTYTEMQTYIDSIRLSPWVTTSLLGTSEEGRNIDLVTITNTAIPNDDKPVIYITGRVHAGEIGSSQMLHGMLDFLISGSPDADRMRNNFVFHIVPMVNPDGTFHGMSRATYPEIRDMNRDWHPDNHQSIELDHVRADMVAKIAAGGIDLFIDWHTQMNDVRWYNFTYAPSGNTFFPILSYWTDMDSQSTGGTSCSVDACSARGYATLELGLLMFGFEPTPHLSTWTVASLNQEGVNVAYAIDEYFGASDGPMLVDSEFDDSADDLDLRTNSPEQDWYESRGDAATKLTLDTGDVGGNSGNKAALKYSDPAGTGYAYLTQEFGSPQDGMFSVSFDIYIDSIADDADRDRSGMVYIGDDSLGTSGPNSTSAERFGFLAFYDSTPGDSGDDIELRARVLNSQSWNTTSSWPLVTGGLSYDTWYSIRMNIDVAAGTYDVYVDNELALAGINKFELFPSSSLTHISFSTGTAAQGDFYVDNVEEYVAPLLVDSEFDMSADDPDLRANSPEQDWYESRNDNPDLLTLNTDDIGGNSTNKAALLNYGISNNTYLTQEFSSPQNGVFTTSFDMYIDRISNDSYDRSGYIYMGYEDAGGTNGPCSTSNERFVFLTFYDSSLGDGGVGLELRAREQNTPAQPFGTTSTWTQVATELSYDTWYTISITADVGTGTYDVYVNDQLQLAGISAYENYASTDLTHISFSAGSSGQGDFYVDNVFSPAREFTCLADAQCDDGEFCNGAETCVAGSCQPGSDPCPGQSCNEASDTCEPFIEEPLSDPEFEDNADDTDLRTDSPGQDWYESRGDTSTMLTLDETDVDGNNTKKALLTGSASGNAYLTQELIPAQTGTFTVQWDIYVDEIINTTDPDRSAYMFIGDDNDGTNGPNSTNDDRFVYMAFYREGGGTTGSMDLVARQPGDGWTGGSFTPIATGLSLDQWYTITVEVDVPNNTYDVFVDGLLEGTAIQARVSKTSLTHISFATFNDGPGIFYVDNVFASLQVDCVLDTDCPDDSLFCNGDEICVDGSCEHTGNPCQPGESCEEPDLCVPGIDDVIFESDFEMGNLINVTYQSGDDSGYRYYTAEVDYSMADFPDKHWWFYFSMDNVSGKTIEIELQNLAPEDFSEGRWTTHEPMLSYDNQNWERLTLENLPLSGVEYDAAARTFTITITPAQDMVWLAPIQPYTVSMAENLLTSLSGSPYLTVSSLGTTPGGQEMTVATITDPAYDDEGKFKIYTIAQQHSAETLSSFVAEGMIRFLLDEVDEEAASMRMNCIFKIILVANPDGVSSGICRYTPDRSGTQYDLNRLWDLPVGDMQPEISMIYLDIQAWNPDIFFDLHTDIQSPGNFFLHDGLTDAPMNSLLDSIATYWPEGAARSSTPYSAQQVSTRLGVHPSVLIEHAHDLANLPGWLDWGKGIVLGLHAYFFPSTPTFISLNPDSASSAVDEPIDFELVVADGNGYGDINTVRFVIKEGTGTGSSADAIVLEYRGTSSIYMWNESEGWIDAVLGSTDILEISFCSLDASQSSVTGDGEILTLNLNITPKAAFIEDPLISAKRIWLRVKDMDDNIFGNEEIGSWTIDLPPECVENDDCDDGLYCNGTETCINGNCSGHSGDPCLYCSDYDCICSETDSFCVGCEGDDDCDTSCNPGESAPDCSGIDNCPGIYNPSQDDTYPPGGNGIGDACDCEGNFDCDVDCDGTDAFYFKFDFGRSDLNNPCESGNPCNGDMDCDQDVDGGDAFLFKNDFGRSALRNPCPVCTAGTAWCTYP